MKAWFAGAAVISFFMAVIMFSSAGCAGKHPPVAGDEGIDGGNSRPFLSRGIAFKEKGLYDEALNAFSQAVRVDPDNAEAYQERGFIYFLRRDYEQAVADFSRAVNLDPLLFPAMYNRAAVFTLTGRYGEAIGDYSRIIAQNP